MRNTRQREAILRVLLDATDHPSAEAIHARVRQELPHISLGTVYRLLHTLEREQSVAELPLANGPSRFDGRPGGHQHIVCTGCGRVDDVPELITPEARREIERWTGYSVSHPRLEWYGLCPQCREADER